MGRCWLYYLEAGTKAINVTIFYVLKPDGEIIEADQEISDDSTAVARLEDWGA